MNGITNNRVSNQNNQFDAVFTDKKDNSQLEPMDFITLMVTQMQNQDFNNPMDNSQMITQMAQFSNMQQMQQMAGYVKTSYAMSLVGKNVTASRFTVGGELETTTGRVDKVSLVDNEYVLYVGGKKYTIEQIMSIGAEGSSEESTVNPAGYPLKTKDITSDTATVEWNIPTEDATVGSKLKYTVYYSKEKDFNTVEQVEKGTQVGAANQKEVTSQKLTDLDPNTTYYVNVVVTDANGVKTVYKPISMKTLS